MRLILLALLFTFVAAVAEAQATATLEGTVVDPQNAAMPGVSVTIRNDATGVERAVVTDASGKYVAASLAPAIYTVVAHLDGFQDLTRHIELGVAQTVSLNMHLSVGSIAENLTVVGISPLIETATVTVVFNKTAPT